MRIELGMASAPPPSPLRYIDLTQFDYIAISTSAGKDSQTQMRVMCEEAARQGVLDRVHGIHADLEILEWPGVKDLAIEQCAHYGIPLHIVKNEKETIIDRVRRRGMWPSPKQRFCTSDFKRGPGRRVFTELSDLQPEKRTRILSCFGFRADESPARARKMQLYYDADASTQTTKDVWTFLPIHKWTQDQVWADIHASGVRYHWAYDLGMPRLSCIMCIMAPFDALVIGGLHNPEILDLYVEVEKETGHRFQHNLSIMDVKIAIQNGYRPKHIENWKM